MTIFVKLFWNRATSRSRSLANISSPKFKSWWLGNLADAINPDAWDFHEMLRQKYGPVATLNGFMREKQLIVYDPKALYSILIKVVPIFYEIIHKVNLTFTSCRPILILSVIKLEDGLASKFESDPGPKEIEMLSWTSRTALELIGQGGLGYSFDSLESEEATHPYTKILKDMNDAEGSVFAALMFLLPPMKIRSTSVRRWLLDRLPWTPALRLRDMADYMWSLSEEIYAEKQRAIEEGDESVARRTGNGKDLISILMKLNLRADEDAKMSKEEVLGQMSYQNFYIFCTRDNLGKTFEFLLLSNHPDAQERLRQEIFEAQELEDKDLSYDKLLSLPLQWFQILSIRNESSAGYADLEVQIPAIGEGGSMGDKFDFSTNCQRKQETSDAFNCHSFGVRNWWVVRHRWQSTKH
ncbi:hypothetical protein D9758_011805 [Tetrapyrgos nigripes]|uniref:Cytochrome P450 n=1 Tax=Tetrapyrgos nigripes TaxID=182062 RepID=A0A8H5CYD8_9AGAR|nr:hypothetical protein D9758_011805 [Tetrapyrgos nigripes]